MIKRPWLLFALITTVFWGTWGALIEIPGKGGFPVTLGYVIWSITMIPCAVVGLAIIKWKLEYDLKSILYGSIIGFLGAGGQLILFHALMDGPAYLVFPIISLSPSVTVIISVIFLKETASKKHWAGIIFALISIVLMSFQKPDNNIVGYLWFVFAVMVFLMWGTQAFFMKLANNRMRAESIFFYMMLCSVLLAPVAYIMTDMSQEINWDFSGPYLTAMIQVLNAIGALMLVYAIRFGKVIIVAPMTNAAAPIITVILSLLIYAVIPNPIIIIGMLMAMTSIYLIVT